MVSAIRFSGARPKQILIDAFSNILPEEVWNRRKSGFTFPFEEWFRKDPEFLQGAAIPNWIREDFSKGSAHWSKLWALEVLSQFD
jgi:asparagine synthase (glutamine-hydrolysing)